MRNTLSTLCLLALFSGPALAEETPGSSFFDGKTTKGWEGIEEFWAIKDGALVGTTPGINYNTFLCSKEKYGDFELSFEVRLKGGVGNSGVQIRSEVIDMKKFVVKGPQCDVGQQYWGSLYGEQFGGMMKAAPADVVKKIVKQDEFNKYSIRCVGKHVTIKINGETTVDGDFPTMPATGIIAFQLHGGPPMEVTFRNIKFAAINKK